MFTQCGLLIETSHLSAGECDRRRALLFFIAGVVFYDCHADHHHKRARKVGRLSALELRPIDGNFHPATHAYNIPPLCIGLPTLPLRLTFPWRL
jgi:hypothetical protein